MSMFNQKFLKQDIAAVHHETKISKEIEIASTYLKKRDDISGINP